MRTVRSREIFTKNAGNSRFSTQTSKGRLIIIIYFDIYSIAKNFMLYCRLIYMLSILCVRLTIKVKVGIPESFKVGWYPPKKLGRVTLSILLPGTPGMVC